MAVRRDEEAPFALLYLIAQPRPDFVDAPMKSAGLGRLAAHCSISGALANYVLESIVKRSRTLVFLAHMQDLRSKYAQANFCP